MVWNEIKVRTENSIHYTINTTTDRRSECSDLSDYVCNSFLKNGLLLCSVELVTILTIHLIVVSLQRKILFQLWHQVCNQLIEANSSEFVSIHDLVSMRVVSSIDLEMLQLMFKSPRSRE